MTLQESGEMYLETILILYNRRGYVRSIDVAEEMQLSRPSVSRGMKLLREQKLLVTCGTGFHWDAPDHFRLVYLPRIEVLEDAMNRLSDFLKGYRR